MIMAMRCLLVVIFNYFLVVCSITGSPVELSYVTRKFQADIQQQNLQTILISLENRLKNLDTVYSMQFSPTVEGKMEQYARKLEALDTKILRMETMVALQLDKISENISMKNFKDDISKTNMLRKIDAMYEGIYNKLTYIEGKFDANIGKINEKMESILVQVDKMEDTLTTRDADIEAELAETTTSIEEIKSSLVSVESNIIGICKEHTNKTLSITEKLAKDATRGIKRGVEEINKTLSGKVQEIMATVDSHKNISYNTDELLKLMKNEIKDDANEYANKVADMYNDMWKTSEKLENILDKISFVLNSTKIENQNGLRSLMVQLGKLTPKDTIPTNSLSDQQKLKELGEKFDTNFAKLFLKQDLFLESCYKLQMDESQLETKISDILEKLISTFEDKTSLQPKDLKSIEQLLQSHESNSKRSLQSIKSNMSRFAQKLGSCKREMSTEIERNVREIKNQLQILFTLMEGNSDFNIKSVQDIKINGDNQSGNISDEEKFYMELLQNNLNYTEYVVGDISDDLKNDINDYSYYIESKNETENATTHTNCTENCTKQANENEEEAMQQINEDDSVTEAAESANVDDSKMKTLTLLDFSNYLIPNEETSDAVD